MNQNSGSSLIKANLMIARKCFNWHHQASNYNRDFMMVSFDCYFFRFDSLSYLINNVYLLLSILLFILQSILIWELNFKRKRECRLEIQMMMKLLNIYQLIHASIIQEAINVYNNVLEYNSTHGLALSNLGNIRLQQKDFVEASKLFEKALQTYSSAGIDN